MVNNDDDIRFSVKEKLLKYLIEHKEPQSIMALSGANAVDYKNTHNFVNKFKHIVSKQKFGNANLIGLNVTPNQEIFSVEHKRTAQFLRDNKKLELVMEDVESIGYPFFVVLVFGSHVNKTKTAKSDIDLCIICDNDEKMRKLLSKLGLLPLKLEIHTFTSDDFEQMLKTKERNVGKEIVKNNIIFYGIENYYHLVTKWMKKD